MAGRACQGRRQKFCRPAGEWARSSLGAPHPSLGPARRSGLANPGRLNLNGFKRAGGTRLETPRQCMAAAGGSANGTNSGTASLASLLARRPSLAQSWQDRRQFAAAAAAELRPKLGPKSRPAKSQPLKQWAARADHFAAAICVIGATTSGGQGRPRLTSAAASELPPPAPLQLIDDLWSADCGPSPGRSGLARGGASGNKGRFVSAVA